MEEQLNKENDVKERKVFTQKRILFVPFLREGKVREEASLLEDSRVRPRTRKKYLIFFSMLLLVGLAVFLGFMLKNRKDVDDKQQKVIEKVQEEKKRSSSGIVCDLLV